MKSHSKKIYTPPNPSLNFDPTLNLLYVLKHSIDYGVKKTMLSRKELREEEHYWNILIWDIDTQKKEALFEDSIALSHDILGFYFERHYSTEEQRIVFNRSLSRINYWRLPLRALSEVLLVVTTERATGIRYLWLSNKKGQFLKNVAQLPTGSEWHLDVGNGILRTLVHSERDVVISEIPWQVPS